MGIIKFENIGIRSISASVPKEVVKTIDQVGFFNEKQLNNFIETTGVEQRRIAPSNMCASDYCLNAANILLDKNNIDRRNEIDALIFISQTPDYKIPGTSIILQNKLGLRSDIIAFDVNLTCSAYLYGLFISYSILNNPNIKNVLLLVGETLSKITSKTDKSTSLLLGDAACASLINKDEKYGVSYFSLNTEGSLYDAVIVPGGGFRNMSSNETLKSKEFEDGSIRNDEQLAMRGPDVFGYAVSKLPKDVKKILTESNIKEEEIDKFIFHQANRFMNQMIVKKLKVDQSKVLYSIEKYGNTSGVSIPLTIVDQKSEIKNNSKILMNAIGAGFSWGSIILDLVDCNIIDLNEL